ncbi:MAG: hypothetical protein WBP79_11885 [Candidatus Acidiferrales bacterium]
MLYLEGDIYSLGPTEAATPEKLKPMKCEGYSQGPIGTAIAIDCPQKRRPKMVAYGMMVLLAVIFFLCLSNGIEGIVRNKPAPNSRHEQ